MKVTAKKFDDAGTSLFDNQDRQAWLSLDRGIGVVCFRRKKDVLAWYVENTEQVRWLAQDDCIRNEKIKCKSTCSDVNCLWRRERKELS